MPPLIGRSGEPIVKVNQHNYLQHFLTEKDITAYFSYHNNCSLIPNTKHRTDMLYVANAVKSLQEHTKKYHQGAAPCQAFTNAQYTVSFTISCDQCHDSFTIADNPNLKTLKTHARDCVCEAKKGTFGLSGITEELLINFSVEAKVIKAKTIEDQLRNKQKNTQNRHNIAGQEPAQKRRRKNTEE